jgi:hypothetical protein
VCRLYYVRSDPLRKRELPQSHLTCETQDVVKLGIGMLPVLASQVLGLLIATAEGLSDTTTAMSAATPPTSSCWPRRYAIMGRTPQHRRICYGDSPAKRCTTYGRRTVRLRLWPIRSRAKRWNM